MVLMMGKTLLPTPHPTCEQKIHFIDISVKHGKANVPEQSITIKSSIHVNGFANLQDPKRCMLARESSSLCGSVIVFWHHFLTGLLKIGSVWTSVMSVGLCVCAGASRQCWLLITQTPVS